MSRRWIVGVDIGGTTLSVGVLPAEGPVEAEPRAFRTIPTERERGAQSVVRRVVELVRGAIEEVRETTGASAEDFVGVGVGSPGPLDRATGVVIETPNLGWTNFPLRDLVEEEVGLPIVLDNDANCAAFGEWWVGAGAGTGSMVALTLGTGVGGGIVIGGRLLHGANDVGGEIGHMTIAYDGRRCACGNRGCLEAYVSGPNVVARTLEGIATGAVTSLAAAPGGAPPDLTAADVSAAARAGDRFAREIVEETGRLLGVGVASLINVLNPEAVVLAGGLTGAGDLLFEPLRAEVAERAFPRAVEACTVVPGALGAAAGVVGAIGVYRVERLGDPIRPEG